MNMYSIDENFFRLNLIKLLGAYLGAYSSVKLTELGAYLGAEKFS